MASDHNPCQLFLILLTLVVVFITSLVISTSLAKQYDLPQPLPEFLDHDLEDLSANKTSPISPAPWLHCLWAGVFVWQIAFAIFGVVCIFKKWSGVPVYTFPELLTVQLLMCYCLACSLHIAWFIFYDREETSTSCLFAVLSAIFCWVAFCCSLRSLDINLFRLSKSERYLEIYLFRLIAQNGLAMYATWCMFVAAFNVAEAMINNERYDIDEALSSVVALTIIGMFMVFYFLMDITCLDIYSRYTATPYIVSIVVLCACIFRQDEWRSDDIVFHFLAVLLAFSFVSLMVKSAVVACRMMRPSRHGCADITTEGPSTLRRFDPVDESLYLLK